MAIDVHAHVIVPELLRERGPESWRPAVSWEDGVQVVELGGSRIRSAVRELVDAEGILAAQTAAGVERTLLCPWVALLGMGLELGEAERMLGIENDALAALAAAHPDRFAVLGGVPLQDPRLAARELGELMRRPGFAGVEVPASFAGRHLGDASFRPFWAAAEEAGALVLIHPSTHGFGVPALAEHYLWNTVGNPLETTICAAQMVFTGLMEEHPGLRVLLAHGGGALLALRGRLRRAWSFQPQARARLRQPPDDSLAAFLYDTVVHDPAVLRELVAVVGAERVLLGSDHPFDMGDERPVETVREAELGARAEALVLAGNAAPLLGWAE